MVETSSISAPQAQWWQGSIKPLNGSWLDDPLDALTFDDTLYMPIRTLDLSTPTPLEAFPPGDPRPGEAPVSPSKGQICPKVYGCGALTHTTFWFLHPDYLAIFPHPHRLSHRHQQLEGIIALPLFHRHLKSTALQRYPSGF